MEIARFGLVALVISNGWRSCSRRSACVRCQGLEAGGRIEARSALFQIELSSWVRSLRSGLMLRGGISSLHFQVEGQISRS